MMNNDEYEARPRSRLLISLMNSYVTNLMTVGFASYGVWGLGDCISLGLSLMFHSFSTYCSVSTMSECAFFYL